jgi:dynactin 1
LLGEIAKVLPAHIFSICFGMYRQRRREEDFLRTVKNYSVTVATLKQEKQALLELQQGGEGEKTDMLAASQNALARAAQLVSDAAAVRKRDAKAALDKIDEQVYRHLSLRLESLLPTNIAGSEISAMKGELIASKVISRGAKTLEGISECLAKNIRPALQGEGRDQASIKLQLSDDVKQKATIMLYQGELAHHIVDISSNLMRFLAAGQWPDLLSEELSIEVGSILGHSTEEIDRMLGGLLKTLKEEGVLTPEQSNIGALQQTILSTLQSIRSDIEREDGTMLPATWYPPGLQLARDASESKFYCQTAAAALSSIIDQSDFQASSVLSELYNKVEQAASQSNGACLRLHGMDVNNEKQVASLSPLAVLSKESSLRLMKAVNDVILSDGDIVICASTADKVLGDLAKLSSSLRLAGLTPSEDESFHALSPETDDCWYRVANLARSVRAVDGDEQDVHYLQRARAIETHLGEAIDNEPKLEIANGKLANLEKSLASKSKEISMQTARLSELEKIIAKTDSVLVGRRANVGDSASADEYNKLKEENRVLMEAVDVMQRQVDEYENEIRVMKDFKSPGKGTKGRGAPRRGLATMSDSSPYRQEENQINAGALEAALFRPALQEALENAAKWKAASMASSLAALTPLPMPLALANSDGVNDHMLELTSALSNYRLVKASTTLVDLTRTDKSGNMQLREIYQKKSAASDRVKSIVMRCQRMSK